jgi:hypothetical protein
MKHRKRHSRARAAQRRRSPLATPHSPHMRGVTANPLIDQATDILSE